MAEFTMALKTALELSSGDIGLDAYPIFSEAHRPVLNQKIIDHYWNQEIGLESLSMFQHAMRRRMNEIMPFYNKLYETELLKFDPLLTMGITTEGQTETTQESESATNTTETGSSKNSQDSDTDSSSRAVASQTPQNRLAGNKDYATSAQDNTGKTTVGTTGEAETTGNSEGTATNNTTANGSVSQEVNGFTGSRSRLLMEFRETILNIDLEIIEKLEDLFMMVWSSGDSNTQGFYYGFRPLYARYLY